MNSTAVADCPHLERSHVKPLMYGCLHVRLGMDGRAVKNVIEHLCEEKRVRVLRDLWEEIDDGGMWSVEDVTARSGGTS